MCSSDLALAGFAGYFAAAQFGFVVPQMLGWHVSATALVMVLIGGLRSVTGPLVGALVLIGLEEILKASTDYWKLIEGLIVIAIVLMLPNGVRQLMPLVFGPSDDDAPVREKNKVVKSATGASHG